MDFSLPQHLPALLEEMDAFIEAEIKSPQLTREALAEVGLTSEAEFAKAIRNGKFDGREEQVLTCLRELVSHRLAISHPGYGDN